LCFIAVIFSIACSEIGPERFLLWYRNADNPREKIAKLVDNDQSILAPITQYGSSLST
jgi:hypothetical protein